MTLRTNPQTRPAVNLLTAARERKSLFPTVGSAMRPPRYILPVSETTTAAVSNLVAAFRPPTATQAATAAAYETKTMDTEKVPQRQSIPVREKQCQQCSGQGQAIQQLPEIGTRFPDFQQTEQNRNATEVKRQILLPELMRGQQDNLFQDLQQAKCHDDAPPPSVPMHTLAIPPDTTRQHPTDQQQNGNMLSVKQGKPFSSRHLFLCRKKDIRFSSPTFYKNCPAAKIGKAVSHFSKKLLTLYQTSGRQRRPDPEQYNHLRSNLHPCQHRKCQHPDVLLPERSCPLGCKGCTRT